MAKAGRPSIDPAWKAYAFSRWADTLRVSVPDLCSMVEEKAEQEGRTDSPSKRTLARWRREWTKLSEDVRKLYLKVSWPYVFEAGLLPWESAAAVLELMYVGRETGRRPSVRLARWYWRLTQAAPDMPAETRRTLAENLCYWEPRAATDTVTAEGAEALLIYAPWRSPERSEVYRQALAAVAVPVPPVVKLEYLEDIDRLRRLSPSERAELLDATAEAIVDLERLREGAVDEEGK